jgi:hypothetical protein
MNELKDLMDAQKIIKDARLRVYSEHGSDNPIWNMLFHATRYLEDQMNDIWMNQ